MFNDTLELLQANPCFFGGGKFGASIAHERKSMDCKEKVTFVFSHPRAGSTLLMRLMRGATMSKMIGDHDKEFYHSFLTMYREIKSGGQYGPPMMIEEKFCDEYRGETRERDIKEMKYVIKCMLFRQQFGAGYAKSCIIGFANDFLVEFCDMLREIFENDNLTLVFLRRNHDDIIKSMHAKTRIDEGVFRKCLEEQDKQFKEVCDLDDTCINYTDILADPIKAINLLNPMYPPNKKAVEKIMKNILR